MSVAQRMLSEWLVAPTTVATQWHTATDAVDWFYRNDPETIYNNALLLRNIRQYAPQMTYNDETLLRVGRQLLRYKKERYDVDAVKLEQKRMKMFKVQQDMRELK